MGIYEQCTPRKRHVEVKVEVLNKGGLIHENLPPISARVPPKSSLAWSAPPSVTPQSDRNTSAKFSAGVFISEREIQGTSTPRARNAQLFLAATGQNSINFAAPLAARNSVSRVASLPPLASVPEIAYKWERRHSFGPVSARRFAGCKDIPVRPLSQRPPILQESATSMIPASSGSNCALAFGGGLVSRDKPFSQWPGFLMS